MSNLNQKYDPQFDNFMYRVTEVNNIVKKLVSKDKVLNQMGTLEADKYLNGGGKNLPECVAEDDILIQVRNNKTIINSKAFKTTENPGTMSQEQFMKEVERDANRRFEVKKVRKEKCETLKTQATKAFRRGEFEKALSCYNKALEFIKDSAMLYLDKALTLINLKVYDEAVTMCETALKLNENSLKAWLLLSKAHYLNENYISFQKCIKEAQERNPKHCQYIKEFATKLKQN